MKKTFLAAVTIAAIFFLFTSARYEAPAGDRAGGRAPGFTLIEGDSELSLQDFRGEHVLLTFWSSTDPESRIANLRYDRIARASGAVRHVAINYDPSEAVFGEVVRADALERSSQRRDDGGSRSRIFRAYKLDKGFRTVLIDPDGVVIAVNPTPDQIAAAAR